MDHQSFLSQHYPNPNPSASMEVMPTSSVLLHLTNPQLMNHNNNNEEEEDDEKVKEENRLQQQHFNVNGLMESHDDADLGQLRNPSRLPSEGRSKWENNNNNNNNKISCLRTGNMVNNHHIPWTAAGEEEGHCYNGALLEGLTDYIHYSSTGQLIQHHELQKYVHKDSSSLPTSKTHSGPNSHTNDPSSIDIIPSIVDMSGTVNANLVSSSSDSLNLLQRYSPEGPVTATRFSRLGGNMNMHSESFTNVVDRGILFTNGHKNLAQEGHTMVSKCSLPEASILNDHVDHNIITILQTPRKKSNLEIKVTTSSMNESDESNMGTQDVSSSCEKMNNSNGRPLGRKRKAGAKRKCTEEEEERDSFSIKPKDVPETDEAGKLKCKKGDDNISFSALDGDQYAKVEQCSTSVNSGESTPKSTKENSVKPPDTAPKQDFIHVRARRGQATDSHSLAERVRREKISERMKYLQDLVPGCSKVTGKAVMLDEIINYVQSLQRQVEFLSMKLAVMNPRVAEFNMETVFGHERNIEPSRMAPSAIHFGQENEIPYPNLHPQHEHNAFVGPHPTSLTNATPPTLNAFGNSLSQGWDIGELQSVVQSGFQGQLFPGQMKTEH